MKLPKKPIKQHQHDTANKWTGISQVKHLTIRGQKHRYVQAHEMPGHEPGRTYAAEEALPNAREITCSMQITQLQVLKNSKFIPQGY